MKPWGNNWDHTWKKKWGVKMGGKRTVLTREMLPWKPNLIIIIIRIEGLKKTMCKKGN
jgi:hypothetical protein